MKKVIIALPLVFIIGCESKPDNTGENRCQYEGAECPNAQNYLRDYQIELHLDTVWLYDADRLVATFINTSWDSKLDSVIMKDNL